MNLYAVLLGGHVAGAGIEVHDLVFVAGTTIEETHGALRTKWFGLRKGAHIDAWQHVRIVDGHRVELRAEEPHGTAQLWFVNAGGYSGQALHEAHASTFVIAETRAAAKSLARKRLVSAIANGFHVDDCLAVTDVDGLYVHLVQTDEPEGPAPVAKYVKL